MPTFEDFSSMDLVESCVPPDKIQTVSGHCNTCWIHNCVRSCLFHMSRNFWMDYTEKKRITDFIIERQRNKPVVVKRRPGFKSIKN